LKVELRNLVQGREEGRSEEKKIMFTKEKKKITIKKNE